jgi:phage FluMu protein Com
MRILLGTHIFYLEYICPVCKQFNPSRKSKQIMLPQQEQEGSKEKAVGKERVIPEESEESEEEEVIDKLKREYLKDEDDNTTIGSRVRKRHTTPSTTVNDTE